MKKANLIVLVLAAVVVAACGRGSGDETPLPTAPAETSEPAQVDGTNVAVEEMATPEPTVAAVPTGTAAPSPTDATPVEATATPEETAAPVAATEAVTPTGAAQEPTATPSPIAPADTPPPPTDIAPPPVSPGSAGREVGLTRIADPNPAPPLTIQVSTVRILDNGYYRLTGMIRNDGSQVYRGVGVYATFFTDVDARDQHSLGKVYGACELLAPGGQCPLSIEIYPGNYVSYLLHPDATPVEYGQPVPLAISDVSVTDSGVGYVRIRGTAANQNAFAVRDGHVSGVLLGTASEILSVGWTVVPGEIAPGGSISFELNIDRVPYADYRLQAQAIRD